MNSEDKINRYSLLWPIGIIAVLGIVLLILYGLTTLYPKTQPESTAHTLTAEDPLKFWKQGYEVGYNNAVNDCNDRIERGNRT